MVKLTGRETPSIRCGNTREEPHEKRAGPLSALPFFNFFLVMTLGHQSFLSTGKKLGQTIGPPRAAHLIAGTSCRLETGRVVLLHLNYFYQFCLFQLARVDAHFFCNCSDFLHSHAHLLSVY